LAGPKGDAPGVAPEPVASWIQVSAGDRAIRCNGIEGIRDRYTALFDAFDFEFSVDDVIAEGDKVVLRWTQTGTHVGPIFGMPATHRSSRTTGIEIWRVENDQLAEHWDVVDVFGQFMQLGLIPQPTASPAQVG
jgi:predicted ester cyclase